MTENRRNAVRWFLSAPELRGPLVVLCATLLVVLLSVIVAGLTSNAEGFLTGLAALSRAVAWPVALVLLLIAFRDFDSCPVRSCSLCGTGWWEG